jgi:hypothetical protein
MIANDSEQVVNSRGTSWTGLLTRVELGDSLFFQIHTYTWFLLAHLARSAYCANDDLVQSVFTSSQIDGLPMILRIGCSRYCFYPDSIDG